MKIVFLSFYSGFIDRGVETFVAQLSKRLAKNHQVLIIQAGSVKSSSLKKRPVLNLETPGVEANFQRKQVKIPFKKTGVGHQEWARGLMIDYYYRKIFLFTLKSLPLISKFKPDFIIPVNGGWQSFLIKTYTLQIFQETLENIGETATEILGHLHNMSNASIYFEGCKETKSGSIKDEVNAVISKDGSCNVPIKTLSGGERTVVDLAVDLAVIDVIENKAGKGANFFIIDEPFDGLDSEGKEQYLELLQTLNSNKQIILVDHSSELKQMISDVITIEK